MYIKNKKNKTRSKIKIKTAPVRNKALRAFLCVLIIFGFCGQIPVFSAVSEKTSVAARNVISNPTNQTVETFTKAMLKEYKKQKKCNQLDDAADSLRAALYFLKHNKNSKDYIFAKEKLTELENQTGLDKSDENMLEIAKNLYLEKKYFASAYEFSNLLEKDYQKDVCYEYLGDIAKEISKDKTASQRLYMLALENNPDNVSAKFKYAKMLLKSNNRGLARLYFEDVIEETNSNNTINEIITIFTEELNANPNDENNYGVLGLAYQKLGQYDKTYKLLRKSIIINPKDIFLRYYLGNLLFNINEYGFADEIYSEILEDNPYESQIRISRAKTYIALQKPKDAIKDYQIVLAMYPDSLQAQYGIYSILKDSMPLDKIINQFYPLENNYSLSNSGWMELGYFANKIEKPKDALRFFEKSLSMDENNPFLYIEIYKLYQLLGDEAKAKKILNAGYKKFPKNAELIELYSAQNSDAINEKNTVALSYLNEGEYKKAIAVYDKVEPKTDKTYEAIANCYRQLGDLERAVANYNNSIQINPDNSEVYYALGVTYLELNALDKAKNAFSLSLEKNEKNVKSKKMLAYIEQKEIAANLDEAYSYYEKKEYQTALQYLNIGANAHPNDPKIFYYRALTKEAMNDYKGAVEDLKQTVKIDRNYTPAYYKLGEALEKTNKEKEALYMYEKYLGAENRDETLAKAAQEKVIKLGEKYY